MTAVLASKRENRIFQVVDEMFMLRSMTCCGSDILLSLDLERQMMGGHS
jgi:hypothetical protein